MTSMPQYFFFLKKNFGAFRLLVPSEILSRYPKINGFHWLRNYDQRTIVMVFREKLRV